MRKPRKHSRVMGWELSRQLSDPGCGLSMAAAGICSKSGCFEVEFFGIGTAAT